MRVHGFEDFIGEKVQRWAFVFTAVVIVSLLVDLDSLFGDVGNRDFFRHCV